VLALRNLRDGDLDAVRSWIESPDALFQWSGPWDFVWPLDVRQLRRDLQFTSERRRIFAAVEEGNDEPVGHAMVSLRPEHGLGLIGRVLIAPARRGSGLATAMMRELLRLGFDELGLHRVQLLVYAFNAPAIALYERLGFVVEGRLRDSTKGTDGYWTGYLMALLEHEYRAQRETACAVRAARIGDGGAIGDLLTQLGYPQDETAAREAVAKWAADPAGEVLVALADQRVVGVVAVHAVPYFERPGWFARILALSVDRDHRRGGVGRRLMGAAEAWASARGCTDVEVATRRTRANAHAFYRSLGYEDLCSGSARFKRALDPVIPSRRPTISSA
jgi:RimJ/RimL family protein N-acetyltransferase